MTRSISTSRGRRRGRRVRSCQSAARRGHREFGYVQHAGVHRHSALVGPLSPREVVGLARPPVSVQQGTDQPRINHFFTLQF